MKGVGRGLQKVVHPLPSVRIAEVETELNAMWSQFNQDISGGQAVMRACMSNLLIYCDNSAEAEVIEPEIAPIINAHPARIVMLNANGTESADETLRANISIYYGALPPDGWQLCGERIDIVSARSSVLRLPSAVRPLLIGDLPSTLWWASATPPLEAGEVFIHLADQVSQIIYNNVGWQNPAKHVADMSSWVVGHQDSKVFSNLAWGRIFCWRKLLSQVLDPKIAESALSDMHTLEIEHGPHALPMTWLLVGWLSGQLDWHPVDGKRLTGSELVWRFEKEHREIKVIAKRLAEGEPVIYRLQVDWGKSAESGSVCLQRMDHERIGIVDASAPDGVRVLIADTTPQSALLVSQLAHRNRDKLFESSVKASNKMTAVFQS